MQLSLFCVFTLLGWRTHIHTNTRAQSVVYWRFPICTHKIHQKYRSAWKCVLKGSEKKTTKSIHDTTKSGLKPKFLRYFIFIPILHLNPVSSVRMQETSSTIQFFVCFVIHLVRWVFCALYKVAAAAALENLWQRWLNMSFVYISPGFVESFCASHYHMAVACVPDITWPQKNAKEKKEECSKHVQSIIETTTRHDFNY